MPTLFKMEKLRLKNFLVSVDVTSDTKTGNYTGLVLDFFPLSEDKTYQKSTGEYVGLLPFDLSIFLDIKAVNSFMSLLIEPVSSYLFKQRKHLPSGGFVEKTFKSKIDKDRYMKVSITKHFYRVGKQGRDKVIISLFNTSDDSEIVTFNIQKRDVSLLLNVLSRVIGSNADTISTAVPVIYIDHETKAEVGRSIVGMVKVDNSLAIDSIWLHGQELLDIMYLTHSLSLGHEIEKKLDSINLKRRQISTTIENGIVYLILTRYNAAGEPIYTDISGKKVLIKIPITATFLSFTMAHVNANMLRHAEYSEVSARNPVVAAGAKYHLLLKESIVGLSVRSSQKEPTKSKIIFHAYTNEGIFGEGQDETIEVFNEDGNSSLVPIIEDLKIDLRQNWFKFLKHLSLAFTGEYISKTTPSDSGEHTKKTTFYCIEPEKNIGLVKYQFTLLSSSTNKAPMVIIIDKYKMEKGDTPDVLLARYRQPLFKKYIFELMKMFMAAAYEVNELDFTLALKDKKDLVPFSFLSAKKISATKSKMDMKYGIMRNGVVVKLGSFSVSRDGKDAEEKDIVQLSEQDIEMLNISAEYRLLMGFWLPFVGDKVAIGQDGFLSDMRLEIEIEEGGSGPSWAAKLFYGTAV